MKKMKRFEKTFQINKTEFNHKRKRIEIIEQIK